MNKRFWARIGVLGLFTVIFAAASACSFFNRNAHEPILEAPTSNPFATLSPEPSNTQAPTDTPAVTNTQAPTDTPAPTNTQAPTNTPSPTNTPTPTSTPTNTPTPTNMPVPTSAGFLPTEQKREGFIPASEMFMPSYFAIIKERLQTYTDDKIGNALVNSNFASYETVFNAADFADYKIENGKVIFTFAGKTLTGTEHATFTYSCDLAEARAFMLYDEEGNPINRPAIRELDPSKKMIALTFDDGPNPVYDPLISEVLLKHNARATFFIITYKTANESFRQSVIDLKAAGHEIASHEYGHEFFYDTTPKKKIWTEVNMANLDIARITGTAPRFLRMAGGRNIDYLKNVPMPQIGWTWGSLDWESRDLKPGETKADQYARKLAQTYKNVTEHAVDGGIILMHVNYAEEPEAVDRILDYLDSKGFICVTVSELFYYKGVTPVNGKRYSDLQ